MPKTTKKADPETKAKKTTKAKSAAKPRRVRKAKSASSPEAIVQVCRITSCKREFRAKGYCKFHYKQWRQGKFGLARYKTCKDNNCRKPMAMNRHGYCEDHFQGYYVKG